MNILAFDTCLDKMYITLKSNDIFLSKVVETTQSHYHSAFLISSIAGVLEERGIQPNDIDLIATNVGPGSFTGIRACTTVARVMAQACNTDVIGVSSLEVLSKINKSGRPTLVALDARKNMAYVSVYDNGNEILPAQAMLVEDLKQLLNSKDYFLITDDALKSDLGGISYQSQSDDLGTFLSEIAYQKFIQKTCTTDWRKLKPLYIQPPAIHVKKA